jgi:hypothetical protein
MYCSSTTTQHEHWSCTASERGQKRLNLCYPLTFALSLPKSLISPPSQSSRRRQRASRQLHLPGLAAASGQQSCDDKVKNPGGRLPHHREKERKGKGTPFSSPRRSSGRRMTCVPPDVLLPRHGSWPADAALLRCRGRPAAAARR